MFLARETGVGNREVVVKVSQRGADEASLLGLLDHPNIVPIHSVASDEVARLSAICMPNLGRTTANQWIETRFKARGRHFVNSPRHVRSVIEIGKGVCQGLQFAHDKKVLHCDVKPSNILITHDGEPVLLDFNLSTDQSSEKHLVGGTLMFMAPEQLERASGNMEAEISAATDVFCLAATLYQMATGQPAFPLDPNENAHLKEVIQKSLKLREEFPEQTHPVPDPLLSVLKDALAFDARDRIPTASAFFERLSVCEKKLARPRRTWQWAAGVLLVIMAAFALKTWVIDSSSKADSGRESSGGANLDKEKTLESSRPAAPLTLEDRLTLAREAEDQEGFKEAVEIYRRLLERDKKEKYFGPETVANIENSLLFCLLMQRKADEAKVVLDDMSPEGRLHPALPTNQVATGFLALKTEVPVDSKAIHRPLSLIKRYQSASEAPAQSAHLAAILNALLVRCPDQNAAAYLEFSSRALSTSMNIGLSKRKAIAYGKVFPYVFEQRRPSTITDADLTLKPDFDLDIPVHSPNSGLRLLTVSLPDVLPTRPE